MARPCQPCAASDCTNICRSTAARYCSIACANVARRGYRQAGGKRSGPAIGTERHAYRPRRPIMAPAALMAEAQAAYDEAMARLAGSTSMRGRPRGALTIALGRRE